jgi:hypothetical protein
MGGDPDHVLAGVVTRGIEIPPDGGTDQAAHALPWAVCRRRSLLQHSPRFMRRLQWFWITARRWLGLTLGAVGAPLGASGSLRVYAAESAGSAGARAQTR